MSDYGKVQTHISLQDVTRITVVSEEGVEFEKYNLYEDGVEIHLQDDGRTLKIFPRRVID